MVSVRFHVAVLVVVVVMLVMLSCEAKRHDMKALRHNKKPHHIRHRVADTDQNDDGLQALFEDLEQSSAPAKAKKPTVLAQKSAPVPAGKPNAHPHIHPHTPPHMAKKAAKADAVKQAHTAAMNAKHHIAPMAKPHHGKHAHDFEQQADKMESELKQVSKVEAEIDDIVAKVTELRSEMKQLETEIAGDKQVVAKDNASNDGETAQTASDADTPQAANENNDNNGDDNQDNTATAEKKTETPVASEENNGDDKSDDKDTTTTADNASDNNASDNNASDNNASDNNASDNNASETKSSDDNADAVEAKNDSDNSDNANANANDAEVAKADDNADGVSASADNESANADNSATDNSNVSADASGEGEIVAMIQEDMDDDDDVASRMTRERMNVAKRFTVNALQANHDNDSPNLTFGVKSDGSGDTFAVNGQTNFTVNGKHITIDDEQKPNDTDVVCVCKRAGAPRGFDRIRCKKHVTPTPTPTPTPSIPVGIRQCAFGTWRNDSGADSNTSDTICIYFPAKIDIPPPPPPPTPTPEYPAECYDERNEFVAPGITQRALLEESLLAQVGYEACGC